MAAITHSKHWRGALKVVGLMNIQFAIPRGNGGLGVMARKAERSYVLGGKNTAGPFPHGCPMFQKATGVPLAEDCGAD